MTRFTCAVDKELVLSGESASRDHASRCCGRQRRRGHQSPLPESRPRPSCRRRAFRRCLCAHIGVSFPYHSIRNRWTPDARRDGRLTGSDKDLVDARALGELPGERMFASAGADKENAKLLCVIQVERQCPGVSRAVRPGCRSTPGDSRDGRRYGQSAPRARSSAWSSSWQRR